MTEWNAKALGRQRGSESRADRTQGRNLKAEIEAVREHIEANRFEEARSVLEAILQENPDAVPAYMAMGSLHARKGEYDHAIEFYSAALHLKKDLPPALMMVGQMYLKKGELDQAMKNFKEALALNPGMDHARLRLGQVYTKMDRIDDAVDCLHEALKHNPQFEEARLGLARIYQDRGDHDAAFKELEGIVARDPEFWRAHIQQAQLLATRGDFRAAVEACKKALKSKPDNTNIHNLLGRCHMELGEHELALREYSLALELDPNMLVAKRGTIRVYMNQGRLAEARKLLITMTKGERSLGLVHRLLAEVLMKEEKYSEAVAEFNAVILHSKKLVEKHPELQAITSVEGDDKKTAESYKEAFEKINMDTTDEVSDRPE